MPTHFVLDTEKIVCVSCAQMDAHTQINFRIEPATLNALRDVRRRIGVPVAEQLRRAVDLWLERNGLVPLPDRAPHRPHGGPRGRARITTPRGTHG